MPASSKYCKEGFKFKWKVSHESAIHSVLTRAFVLHFDLYYFNLYTKCTTSFYFGISNIGFISDKADALTRERNVLYF